MQKKHLALLINEILPGLRYSLKIHFDYILFEQKIMIPVDDLFIMQVTPLQQTRLNFVKSSTAMKTTSVNFSRQNESVDI
jgi:hypothetical protein